VTACNILLDKSVFVGTGKKELADFISAHTIILPETLFYECYTSDELSDKKFLRRLQQLLKADAYVSYQLMEIIRDEGQNLCPCTCIIDQLWTDELRKAQLKTITNEEIDKIKNDRSRMALSLKKLASKASTVLTPDQLEEIRRLNMAIKERFHKWIEMADRNDIHNLAAESFRKYVKDPEGFCLSMEWLSWHYMRLLYAKALEYSYLEMTGSCPSDENTERDLMDIEYLVLLVKCNALLTNDRRLQDLAEVAFPNKKIYSSIQEIRD